MLKILLSFTILLTSISLLAQTDAAFDKDTSILHEVIASPNPFHNKTEIFFTTNVVTEVNFTVRDILGSIVYAKKTKSKIGENSFIFYRKNLKSGIYIYTVKTNFKTISKRIIIK